MTKNPPNKKAEADLVLPGLKPVLEILSSDPARVSKVYCLKSLRLREKAAALCQSAGIPIEYCDSETLDSLAKGSDHKSAHQGLAALLTGANLVSEAELFRSASSAPLPLILALDQVQDPGNLGALCRTAYALGAAGLLLPKHDSASLGPAAFKASMGSLAVMPIAIAVNLSRALDLAEEEGLLICGAGMGTDKAESAFTCDWSFPAILVLGNEQKGVRPGVAKRCARDIAIPFQRPFDSLNIAQAGAVLLGLCARYRSLS